jgi:predicted GNAT superfamily acetyltransferase
MEWTFDPLELKNAYFNIERLGAIVRRFTRNQYGTTSSRLHAGLPTDRCTAEWWMASDRVNSVLAGNPVNHGEIVARIEIPLDLEKDRAGIQAAASAQFERYLDAGLAVIGFEKSPTTGTYLLGEYK